jgi:hypothetical protein
MDTPERRASAIGLGVPGGAARALPSADGAALDQADRQHLLGLYRGVLAALVRVLVPTGGTGAPAYPRFTLALYGPLPGMQPLPTIDINPDVTALRWTTQDPGGYGTLEVGLRDWAAPAFGLLPEPAQVPLFGHVEVYAGHALVWEGRVVMRRRAGGLVRGFRAVGYLASAGNDDWFASTDTTPITMGTALRTIAAVAAPLWRLGTGDEFEDPGTSDALANYNRMTPAQVVEQMCRTGADGVAWSALMYAGRRLRFVARRAPVTPTYAVPFDATVETWDEDAEGLYGAVTLAYTAGGVETLTEELVADGFVDRYGLARRALVAGGEISADAAGSFAAAWLAQRGVPEVSASIARAYDAAHAWRGLELADGGERPPWLVRAGEWVRVGDEPARPLSATAFDANRRLGTFSLGALPLDPAAWFARLFEVTGALLTKTDPVTGGRVR